MRAFYGGVLGLKEKEKPESLSARELVWFEAGTGDLELHFLPEDGEDGVSSGRHFCLEVDDIEECRTRLADAGHETRDATPIPGRPRFFAYDPFSNLIEFTQIVGDYRGN